METLISNALQAAAFAHHQEFHDLDHTDPDWSTWYANWLLDESEVSEILEPYFGASQLAHMLHKLDGRYRHSYGQYDWCDSFAKEIAPQVRDQQ